MNITIMPLDHSTLEEAIQHLQHCPLSPPTTVMPHAGCCALLQDYSQVVATHRQTGADITIVTHSIEEKDAGRRGLMRVNPDTGAHMLPEAQRLCSGKHESK